MRVVDVNVRAPVALLRTFLPPMTERGRGAVVLMTSLAGNQGTPRIAAYAASKAFTRVLAESLWYELKDRGIDVVACCAGAVRTPGYAMAAGKDAPGTLDPEKVVEQTLRALGHGPVVIPGFINRAATVFMSRLLPRRTAIAIMAGSTEQPRRAKGNEGQIMTDFIAGFFAPWIIYALILGLHLALPARRVAGYVRDDRTGTASGVPAQRAAGAWRAGAAVGRGGYARIFSTGTGCTSTAGRAWRAHASSGCSSASPWSCPPQARAARSWPISTSAARRIDNSSTPGWTPRCSSTWWAPPCSR